MYPLSQGNFAPRNQWYVAAWSSQVSREPMERWILDEPIVFYRKENSEVVALDGRCPHRLFPLAHGKVEGDNIVCGYHGFKFGPDGACVEIPTQEVVPRACAVKTYPTVELWDWIWIWPGDPALADVSLIPDHFAIGATDPAYKTHSGWYAEIQGRYTLMHDNLFDLTHVHHLHYSSLGTGELKPVAVNSGQGWIETCFEYRGIDAPPYVERIHGYSGKVDRFTTIRFFFPSMHVPVEEYRKVVPNGEVRGELVGRSHHYHVITPGKRNTCHYFFAGATPADHPDPDYYRTSIEQVYITLEEDVNAISWIEALITNGQYTPKEVLIATDAGCVIGRRMFDEAISAEKQGKSYLPREPASLPEPVKA